MASALASMLGVLYFASLNAFWIAIVGGSFWRMLFVAPMAFCAISWSSRVPLINDPLWGHSLGRLWYLLTQLVILCVSTAVGGRWRVRSVGCERVIAGAIALVGLGATGVMGRGQSGWADLSAGAVMSRLAGASVCVSSARCSARSHLYVHVRDRRVVYTSDRFVVVTEQDGTVVRALSAPNSRFIAITACRPCVDSVDSVADILSIVALASLGVIGISAARRHRTPMS